MDIYYILMMNWVSESCDQPSNLIPPMRYNCNLYGTLNPTPELQLNLIYPIHIAYVSTPDKLDVFGWYDFTNHAFIYSS